MYDFPSEEELMNHFQETLPEKRCPYLYEKEVIQNLATQCAGRRKPELGVKNLVLLQLVELEESAQIMTWISIQNSIEKFRINN